MGNLFCRFAKVERDFISERTREGFAFPRANGRLLVPPERCAGQIATGWERGRDPSSPARRESSGSDRRHESMQPECSNNRLKDAGLSDAFSPHSFRATGVTNFLENGGTRTAHRRPRRQSDNKTL